MILFVALFFAVGILVIAAEYTKRKKCIESTIGTVIDIDVDRKYDRNDHRMETRYYPVFQYDANGETYVKKSTSGSNRRFKYDINSTVNIMYDPNNPNTYYVQGNNDGFILGIIFIVISIILLFAL